MSDVIYQLDQDQLDKLRAIAAILQGGSDKERDQGHKLWALVNQIEEQRAS